MAMPLALALAVLSPAACTYDYAALSGPPNDMGIGQTGGSTVGPETPDGSAAAAGMTGGAGPASGGRVGPAGTGGGGGPAAGGAGTGGRGNGGGGAGGFVAITGGAGGSGATGVATGGSSSDGRGGGTGLGGATAAGIISIDFVGGMPMAAPASGGAGGNAGNGATTVLVAAPAMTPTEVAGVRPVARWNSAPGLMGTLNNLVQADGMSSSASATWNATPSESGPGLWKNRFTDAPGNVRMMNGYLDPPSNALPATVTISNLPAGMAAAGYDVYVYVSGDVPTGTRLYTYAIGANTASLVQTGPTPATFSGFVLAPEGGMGNYIIFRNVTGTAFTLTARPPVGTLTRAPLNGMQIVSPPGS